MALADAFAALAVRVSAAVGSPYWSGLIISQASPGGYNNEGVFVPGAPPSERPCRVQIDQVSDYLRAQAGYADTDYRFIILSASFSGALDTDVSISVTDGPFQGQWAVSGLVRDPAGIGYVGTGRKA